MTILSSSHGPRHPRRKPKVVLLDLDDTLYRTHEVPQVVHRRIEGEAWADGAGRTAAAQRLCVVAGVVHAGAADQAWALV